jgi:hypothetical protein
MAGKQILKGVRINRRFGKKDLKKQLKKSTLINQMIFYLELQMQHRNMKN